MTLSPLLPCQPTQQDLVDLAKPGDRITVTGVYRAMGVRTNPRLRELKVGHAYLPLVSEVFQLLLVWQAAGLGCARRPGPAARCASLCRAARLPLPLLCMPRALPPCLPLPPSQAVYKTYIDVVHIQKDEASNMFSMFAAEETQESQEAPADASALAADAPDMQVGASWGGRVGQRGEGAVGWSLLRAGSSLPASLRR